MDKEGAFKIVMHKFPTSGYATSVISDKEVLEVSKADSAGKLSENLVWLDNKDGKFDYFHEAHTFHISHYNEFTR